MRQQLSPLKQYLLGFSFIFGSLVIAFLTFLYLGMKPRLDAQENLSLWGTEVMGLSNLRDFRTFNGEATYYSLVGDDANQKEMILVMLAGSSQPQLIDIAEGLSSEKLLQQLEKEGVAVDRLSFGYYKEQLVWEVKSQQTYYLYDFKTGELLRTLG